MRATIEAIINGLSYNTETADLVASDEWWDGSNHERHGRNTHLYKTKKGKFFLGESTRWQGERDHIEALSLEDAKDYYERLPEKAMSYQEAFGEEPEEA